MTKYNKAFMALLGSAATAAGHLGLNLDPELVSALGVVVTSVLVYVVPNTDRV